MTSVVYVYFLLLGTSYIDTFKSCWNHSLSFILSGNHTKENLLNMNDLSVL